MSTPYRLEEVRALVTQRIAGLRVPDAYRQSPNDAWREAMEPIVPEWEPATRAHLAFFVDDRDLIDSQRSRSTIGDPPLAAAPLVVRFLFNVRALAKTENGQSGRLRDWDAASEAARHVLRELISSARDPGGDADKQGQANGWSKGVNIIRDPRPISRLPRTSTDGDTLLVVEVRVIASYTLSMAAPAYP